MDNYVKVFFTDGTDIRIETVSNYDTDKGVNYLDKNGALTLIPYHSIKYIVLIPSEDSEDSSES